MGFELLGTGAGAAHGLEDLLTRQRADELMRQQGMEKVIGLLGLREDRQGRLAQQKMQADALAQSRADANNNRRAEINRHIGDNLPAGTELNLSSFQRLTDPNTGGLAPEQFDESKGTPASLASTSLSGFLPINHGQMGAVTETQEPSKAIPASFRFKGSAPQQEKAAALQSVSSSREAAVQAAADRASQAWERLRLEGDNQSARLAAQNAGLELQRARLEAARQHNEDAAAKTPQPQFFKDVNGSWHAGIFDKGQFSEVPLPKGFTPTKAGPASTWDSIKNWFSGNGAGPASDPTDPNWGK